MGMSPCVSQKASPGQLLRTFKHHDLASFLEYSYSGKLNQKSTIFRGTLYEYTVRDLLTRRLAHLGLGKLTKVGGAADQGIDLVARWKAEQPFTLLIQCKSSRTKIGAIRWRELAGVHVEQSGLDIDTDSGPLPFLTMLASPSLMTGQAYLTFTRLAVPLMYCQAPFVLPTVNKRLSKLECQIDPLQASFVLNDAAQRLFIQNRLPLIG